jgi:hypothetical protein
MPSEQSPFADLPAALVEEVLGQASAAGDLLLNSLREVKADRSRYRQALLDKGLVQHESGLGYPPPPTTCATDGSYTIERLLTADLSAAAAVAVEGLTPPSEKRHWDQPHHSTFVVAETHHSETATVLRAVMLGRELLLAARAPHDLVMLDGTLTLPIIYFNQALNLAPEPRASSLRCSKEFLANCVDYLDAYRTILTAPRSDKNICALPKYSSRREIGSSLGWPGTQDDRAFLTLLLQPGELVRPVRLEQPDQKWHLNTGGVPESVRSRAAEIARDIVEALERVQTLYYKPHVWLPALRVEVASDVATNKHRLASVIQGLKHQCGTASMLEPYPVYLADRTVKALARAVPAFRQVATQRISETYEGDISDVFFAMHGYRSDIGG